MRMKRMLSLVLTVLLCLPHGFVFADYAPSPWAADAVEGAMNFSIVSEEFSKKPYEAPISRADFINIAVNLYATITAENVSTHATNPFSDTTDPFPNMAYYAGIVSGDGNGNFNPKGTLTRQELCKIITGLLDSAGVLGPYFPSEHVFDELHDADKIAQWAKNHVAFMMDNNLMAGDDQGNFRPTDPVKREEAAIVAYRCFVRYGKDFNGTIKTKIRQTKDAEGNTIHTLMKTVLLPSGATVDLASAFNPEISGGTLTNPDGQPSGFAPSGTPLQVADANGLYRLKTYSETIASGEAAEKEARIFPDGKKFTSAEEANAKMSQVTVSVWKVDKEGKYYTDSLTFKIHSVLKDDVIAIFEEIYNAPVKAPIKDVNAYSWRNAMSSGTYSDHNYGVAIDLNYNENYCVYASGMVVGTFYDPKNSIYSFPSDGAVVQTFAKYGWLWGGNAWVNGTVDHMHFSYLGK